MIELTLKAVDKVLEIISKQDNRENIAGLRVSVVGGGCSGFSYSLSFVEDTADQLDDKILEFEGTALDGSKLKLKVFVDQASLLYLDGNVDYAETLEGAGFKFNNPSVKSTCGCGSSFSS